MRRQKTVLIRDEYPLTVAKELAAMLRRAGRKVTLVRGRTAKARRFRLHLTRGEVPYKIAEEARRKIRAKLNLSTTLAVSNRVSSRALNSRQAMINFLSGSGPDPLARPRRARA